MECEILLFPSINSIEQEMVVCAEKIHIRIKQRNGKKSITSVENLPETYNLMAVIKKMRKTIKCGGSIQTGTNGKFIQLFGDQRASIKKFLIDSKIVLEENIITHGY